MFEQRSNRDFSEVGKDVSLDLQHAMTIRSVEGLNNVIQAEIKHFLWSSCSLHVFVDIISSIYYDEPRDVQ